MWLMFSRTDQLENALPNISQRSHDSFSETDFQSCKEGVILIFPSDMWAQIHISKPQNICF